MKFDFSLLQKPLTAVAAILCVLAASAQADEEEAITPEAVPTDEQIDFQKHIFPILRANCVACHNGIKAEGDLNLEDGPSLLKGGASGPAIVPGKPDESYLYLVATRREEPFMPPLPNDRQARKLTPREAGLLKQWIVQGAKIGQAAKAAMNWQPINDRLKAVYAVDIDSSGRFVAAGRAGTVTVYDLARRETSSQLIDPQLTGLKSSTQLTHRDFVHAIAIHPDNDLIATAGYQVVKLWKRDVDSIIQPLGLPPVAAHTVTSENRQLAAVQQKNGQISVVNCATREVIHSLDGQAPESVTLLGIHTHPANLISVCHPDASVRLIQCADGAVAAESDPLPARALRAVLMPEHNALVVLCEDGHLYPMTLNTGEKKLVIGNAVTSPAGPIRQMEFGNNLLLCRGDGPTVELRRPGSLEVRASINSGGPLAHAAISADGSMVVTVTKEGKAEVWFTGSSKRASELTSDAHAMLKVQQLAFNKAARAARVNVVTQQIQEAEKRVKEQQDSLKKIEEDLKKATEALAAARKKAEEESAKAAAAEKASAEKPDDADLKKQKEDAAKAAAAAKDAVTNAENTLQSAQKGKELSEQAVARATAVVQQKKDQLTTIQAEATAAAEAHAAAVEAAKKPVTCSLACFVGSDVVATIDQQATVRLWNANDGRPLDVFSTVAPPDAHPVSLFETSGGPLVLLSSGQAALINVYPGWKLWKTLGAGQGEQESVFTERVLALAFSPDGRLLAAGGGEASRSGEITIWNVADGQLVRRIADAHSDTVYGLEFSPDGKLLASAAADKFVKVFDVATGRHVRSYEGHTHHVMDVSWKGDGTQLASAGADNAIKIWNAETGEQARTISTYSRQVTSLEFIGLEDDFVSCSGDKRVFRHKASNGGAVREFKGSPDYVYCTAVTPDGRFVVAGGEDGIVRIWDGTNGKEIAAFGLEKP